ncbi:hypothetical protein Tco_0662316 [Tanacetum coccineum]
MNDEVQNPNPQNTSPSEINEPYEPSPRMDLYEQPSCLGSTFVSETLRKNDQMHQTFEKSYLAMTHKLDDMIELPKSQPMKTYKEDLECEMVMVKVLPSFEVYTPPATYLKEEEDTIGIPMEVELLDHIKLKDLGLNTCSYDLFLSSREIPSVDELSLNFYLIFHP